MDLINSSEENLVANQTEDHLALTSKLYMKIFSDQINDSTKKCIDLAESSVNPSLIENDKQNTKFADYFLKYYVTVAPLWSSLMLGYLNRFNNSINNTPTSSLMQLNIARTSNVIKKCFSNLKNVSLQETRRNRLDDFALSLYNEYVGFQKLSALNIIKTRRGQKRSKNVTL